LSVVEKREFDINTDIIHDKRDIRVSLIHYKRMYVVYTRYIRCIA